MELNREQIIKALQGHIGVVDMRCEECPYNQDNGSEICVDLLLTDSLALIESYEKKIKELTEVVKQSETAGGCEESVNNGFSPSVTELQRENERLRAIPEQICEKARQMCFIVGDEEYITLCELDQIAQEMVECKE